MTRPGWNPTRRNRNQGTRRRGLGQDNRLVIPDPALDPRVYWERLQRPVMLRRQIGAQDLLFIVEPTRVGAVHTCTVEDLAHVLGLVPAAHLAGLAMIVLRQPTRKQTLLRPVWGRLDHCACIGPTAGPAIILEAQQPGQELRWGRQLDPSAAQELQRLRDAGHEIRETRRDYRITSSLAALRATQLYHTLPHELGHHVDYQQNVGRFAEDAEDAENKELRLRVAAYNARSRQDKEAYAHRYADEFRQRMIGAGHLPFARRAEPAALERDGLDPRWFLPPS